MKRSLLWLCTFLLSTAAPGLAQHVYPDYLYPNYLDNRSTPVSLLRSLYNAVNRREYARAYSYWETGSGMPGTPPPYETFVQGYATTESVTLVTGEVASEGAAGSIYAEVPVRLEATRTDGAREVFVGCYTLRFIQPGIQEPPFIPLRIAGSDLRRAVSTKPQRRNPPASLCRNAR